MMSVGVLHMEDQLCLLLHMTGPLSGQRLRVLPTFPIPCICDLADPWLWTSEGFSF